MTSLVALSVSIGVLGGVATWIFLSAWSGPILIWAAFAAWACYFHSGGDDAALKSTIIGNIFGVVCAWVALVIILSIPLAETLSLPVWAGICVGGTVLILCLAAHHKLFAVIPASVYGYACAAGFALQTPDKLSLDALLSASLDNTLIVVPISMVLGAVFGLASGKLAGALTKSE